MEYNEKYHILFEKSILQQLFAAYKYDFPEHELVDEIYSEVRIFNPDHDQVHFVYHDKCDYNRLVKFIRKVGKQAC